MPLILLRAADCASSIDQKYDTTQLDPKQQSATMALLSSGFNKMGSLVKEYSNKSSHDNGDDS